MKAYLFLSLVICCGPLLAQSGGSWAITSSTIDGGGDTSVGGTWSATGTIGQPDATVQQSTGATWTFEGGFWPGVMPDRGAPVLAIYRLDPSSVVVAWTIAAVGYKLQYSTDLVTWYDYPSLTIQGASFITWPLQLATRCFFCLKAL